jgi:hypothetical protein
MLELVAIDPYRGLNHTTSLSDRQRSHPVGPQPEPSARQPSEAEFGSVSSSQRWPASALRRLHGYVDSGSMKSAQLILSFLVIADGWRWEGRRFH